MKKHSWIFLILLFTSCHTTKNILPINGDKNKAIEIAVNDFLDNCNLRNTDSIFSVNIYIDNDSVLGLSIAGKHENKIFPLSKDTIGAKSNKFPSNYIEKNNKIVYWLDGSNPIISEKIINILSRYNHIDSTYVNEKEAFPDYVLNERVKSADYYFCKKNLFINKRIVSKIAMGWYPQPKLKCQTCNKK